MNENQNHTDWMEISIIIDPAAHEAVGAFLIDLGCEGIVTEDFDDHTLKAYIPLEEDPDILKNRIAIFLDNVTDIFPEIEKPEVNLKSVENQDWATAWRSFFYLDQVTDNLMILPAWEDMPENTNCRIIRIDPGTAFGTGKHPTTRMCLAALEEAGLTDNCNMLDVGTGSGILSVYGAMLGAGEIVAIDIDPEAVRWAEKNIALNELPVKIQLSDTPIDRIRGTYQVITANLILNTILELSGFFPSLLASGGRLILSGLLREQVFEVEKLFSEHGLNMEKTIFMEEWACLVVRKD